MSALDSERLALLRSDRVDPAALLAFFERNLAHLRPWLPEAEPLVRDPAFRAALLARGARELAEGREERWFFAMRNAPDVVLGYVFLTKIARDGHRSCELAYGIDEAHAGRGLMREAVERMLRHARETLGLTCVNARYAVHNDASARLLDRLGFQRIGVAPQHAWLDGAWRDHVLVTRVQRDGPPT